MKNIIWLLMIPVLTSCYEQQRNCKDYKTGSFRFEHEINGVKKTTYFTRTDSLEIESYEGKTDTAVVRWVSDCEYILRKKNPKNMQEKNAIGIKILTTSNNSYTFEFGVIGNDAKQRGTVTKLD
jgi:hypothetical protein